MSLTTPIIDHPKAVELETINYILEQIPDIDATAAAGELKHYLHLALKVIDQTERRVFKGENVPSSEKVVSIFEEHTDIIKKDRRETYYGHKVCLCVGASQLITDCLIKEGNPADTDLTATMLERQKEIYGRYPLKAAMDGGFASKPNLPAAKGKGIKDVCFAKKKGLDELDMCRSRWVYKRLRNFRAGVEAVISWIKRSLGFNRCNWKGPRSFGSYVWLSVVSANLRTLAAGHTAWLCFCDESFDSLLDTHVQNPAKSLKKGTRPF